MNEQELFKEVYEQVLDYADTEVISRLAGWGLDTHKLLKTNGRLWATIGTRDKDWMFIYAVSTAVIVGEFGKFAFGQGNYFPDECEIELDTLGLSLNDIKGYLDGYPDDVSGDRIKKLLECNCVSLEGIGETVGKYKTSIHDTLVGIYKDQGEKEPDYKIYSSLLKIFEMKDEETGEMFLPQMDGFSISPEQEGYSYVSNGFQL